MSGSQKLPTLEIEMKYWSEGYELIVGIDEVGRGPLAGPVVAGAVIFPKSADLPENLKDSKKLTKKRRENLDELIKEMALDFGTGAVGNKEIDKIGIAPATELAMKKALGSLKNTPDFHLIDYFTIDGIPKDKQNGVKKGDEICASISAASIIAKVHRDNYMIELHEEFPHYGFETNVGYGTKKHREAIKKHGPSPHHRRSFLGNIL